MPTERKIEQVAQLEDRLKRCTIAVTTEYRGLTVAELAELRAKLREKQVELVVVKNTLAAIAGDQAGKPGLRDVLQGPTAIAFGYGEVVDAPKTIHDHIQATKISINMIGAVMDGQVLNAVDIRELAILPPKPILMSQLLAGLLGPLYGLSYTLNYHISGLARVLDAARQKMEASSDAPAQEAAATSTEAPAAEVEAPAVDPEPEAEQAPSEESTDEPEAPATEERTDEAGEEKKPEE